MLGWLKKLPGENKYSCTFIYFSINSLSTAALKLLWIELTATWTWTVVAGITRDLATKPIVLDGQTSAKEKGSFCLEELVFTVTERVILLLLSHEVLVKISLKALLQDAMASSVTLVAKCFGNLRGCYRKAKLHWSLWGSAQGWTNGIYWFCVTSRVVNHSIFLEQLQCETSMKSPGISFPVWLPWPQHSKAVWHGRQESGFSHIPPDILRICTLAQKKSLVMAVVITA